MPSYIKNNSARNMKIHNWIQQQWTQHTPWHLVLLPLSWCFGGLVAIRRWLYARNLLKSYQLPVPVIVIGNINVGGAGKTPLVIWLVQQLKAAGFKPGVISRGYGAEIPSPVNVTAESDPASLGDEPVLIAQRALCPVAVFSDRVAAARELLLHHPECDVIISDDGLQHYRMQRQIEVVVFDAVQKFGNRALLPAGPLRETLSRLKTVDAIVCNGDPVLCGEFANAIHMQLIAGSFYNLADSNRAVDAAYLKPLKLLAIAGIGHPQRFFDQLKALGLTFETRTYKDHHVYHAQDFENIAADAVVMTEKDAVKCKAFAQPNLWVLPVEAELENRLMPIILAKLNH